MKSKKNKLNQKVATHDLPLNGQEKALSAPNLVQSATFEFLLAASMRDDVVLIPAENIALHVLDLPIRSVRQRREAVPYALEEILGGGLEDVHFAIHEVFPDSRLLVAVLNKALMDVEVLSAPDSLIVAEQMLLPPSSPEADGAVTWRTFRDGDRVLIRVSDGTGFAAHVSSLRTLWDAAGKPHVEAYGTPLPDTITTASQSVGPIETIPSLGKYDLRQGGYQPSRGLARPLRWLAAVFVCGLLTHLGLAAADVRAQRKIADRLQAAASLALEDRLPNANADDSPALLRRQIESISSTQRGSNFLPLMNNVSEIWLRDAVPVQVRQLNWSGNVLRLVVETPDLEALQRAEASLAENGLQVSSGSAIADAGSARAELTVQL